MSTSSDPDPLPPIPLQKYTNAIGRYGIFLLYYIDVVSSSSVNIPRGVSNGVILPHNWDDRDPLLRTSRQLKSHVTIIAPRMCSISRPERGEVLEAG